MGNHSICLVFLLTLFLLAGCTAVIRQQMVKANNDNDSFSLFLQPLPQEMHRLSFTIEALAVVSVNGKEIPLPLEQAQFDDQLIGVQKRLANLTLPPGRYSGVSLKIGTASLRGEEGVIDLLPPQERVLLTAPFIIRNKQAITLFMSLSPDRLVTDGVFFTPRFSLWKPERLLVNLKGFVCSSTSQSLTVFNKRVAQVAGHIWVGRQPVDLALDQRRSQLYVALAGEDAIAVVEVNNGTIIGRVPLRFGDEPVKLTLSEDGRTLLALNRGSETVSIIDTGSLFETSRVRLRSQPSGMFIGSAETVYVTHASTNTLSVLDLQTGSLRGTVPLDEAPLDGVSDERERALYLINDFSSDLLVLDSASLTVRSKIFVGSGATTVLLDRPQGLLYIGRQNGEIAVVDPRVQMAIDSFALAGPVRDLTIDAEENALFAVLPQSDELIKLDLVSKRELGRVELGSGSCAVVVMGER